MRPQTNAFDCHSEAQTRSVRSQAEPAAMGMSSWSKVAALHLETCVTVTRKEPQPGDRKIDDHQFSRLWPDDTEYRQKRVDNRVT